MASNGLTAFAWIFMLTSMISITVLVSWCFYRILTSDHDFGAEAEKVIEGQAEST
ncbi:MAG: hypothetical protein Q8W48_06985 [Candidatus Palauibacterales bacterium]|nr:hypothetical protein [Candidatus Palauibacterales bacterium]